MTGGARLGRDRTQQQFRPATTEVGHVLAVQRASDRINCAARASDSGPWKIKSSCRGEITGGVMPAAS
jgi:hypothetical protein